MKFFEMRTYTIKPCYISAYLKVFEEIGYPIATKYMKNVGYWYYDIGTINRVVHIWEWESLDQRAVQRKALYADKDWQEKFLPQSYHMIDEQKCEIMYATAFSPIK